MHFLLQTDKGVHLEESEVYQNPNTGEKLDLLQSNIRTCLSVCFYSFSLASDHLFTQ